MSFIMIKNYLYKMYEWETLSYDFMNSTWNCKNTTLLRKPILSLSIQRNKNLSISMVANIKHDKLLSQPKRQLGQLISDFEQIEMYNDFGSRATATVTHIINNNLSWDQNGNPTNKAIINVEQLEVHHSDTTVHYTIEWITNLKPEGCWRWPDSTNMNLKGKFNKEYSSTGNKVTISREDIIDFGMSLNCLGFPVNDHFVFIGETSSKTIDKKYFPGFILYQGSPSPEKMEKIRLGLSYTLGRYLPSLGCSRFDNKWDLVSYKCIAPYHIEERVYNSQTEPPSKLNNADIGPINSNIVSKSINSFCDNFEKYDLKHISWLYWHAVTSPVHVQASQLGATIESIQRNYIKVHERFFQTKLFQKKEWKEIQSELIHGIEELLQNNNSDEKRILLSKIQNLNQTPQRHLTDRFFEILDLRLSDHEKEAFKQRNYSAHGEKGNRTKFTTTKNNNILRTLLNRVLIKIMDTSIWYIDYYSIGYPQRNIGNPVGSD